MVCQYLDDVCGAAPAGSPELQKFEDAYRHIASHLGVLLAPTTDPDKAFSPCTHGTVLGVCYDTMNWTWSIPPDKYARLLNQIRTTDSAEKLKQHEIWSLVGRILHYAPLVPDGKFFISELIKANSFSKDRNEWVVVTAELRRQLHFWWCMLKTLNNASTIPAPTRFPAWTVEFHTDAAGGSLLSPGHGTGGCSGPFWFYVPWGRRINCGMRGADGKRFSRKLSALELVGPLICVSAGRELCRLNPVRIWVDNAGSVSIFKKGYSTTCDLCNTLVGAIARVSTALGCKITIDKIARCSDTSSQLADFLSKGRFSQFLGAWPADQPRSLEPAWIPPEILDWIDNPRILSDLGERILSDIKNRDGYI
jgi:hypothetical protein